MASGVHQSSLSTLMKRKSTPSVYTLQKICNGLGMSLSKFFAVEEDSYSILAPQQRTLVESFDDLDETGKKLLQAYANGLLDMQMAKQVKNY